MAKETGTEDKAKIVRELENAYRYEKKIGLVLQQILERTELNRERVKLALRDLVREGKIGVSDLTSNKSKRESKIYYLKRLGYQTEIENLPSQTR
jgi:hypothetical protein